MKSNQYFNELIKNTPEYINRFTNKSLGFVDSVHLLLAKKQWTLQDLSDKTEIPIEDLDEMLTLAYNLTIKEISKIEAAFNEDIFIVVENPDDEIFNTRRFE